MKADAPFPTKLLLTGAASLPFWYFFILHQGVSAGISGVVVAIGAILLLLGVVMGWRLSNRSGH
jgi:hypothetical protein